MKLVLLLVFCALLVTVAQCKVREHNIDRDIDLDETSETQIRLRRDIANGIKTEAKPRHKRFLERFSTKVKKDVRDWSSSLKDLVLNPKKGMFDKNKPKDHENRKQHTVLATRLPGGNRRHPRPKRKNKDKARSKFCRCKASGDPHYLGFDGQMIDFMGVCMYTLAQSLKKRDRCAFHVKVKNEIRNGVRVVSWTRLVDFSIYGITIRLKKGKKVFVNGLRKFPPFVGARGRLLVSMSGRFIQIKTKCGIEVAFDGRHMVKVKVPRRYSGKMCGLCGDCNGVKDDLRLKNGTDVSHLRDKFSLIGNSYLVFDNSDKPQTRNCQAVKHDVTCRRHLRKRLSTNEKCGMITDLRGPFKECTSSLEVEAHEYFNACVTDTCLYKDNPSGLLETLCKALESFASECEDSGIAVTWRKPDFCALPCGEHMHYNPSISGCLQSCGSHSADMCDTDLREGCECDEGYVMSGDICVPRGKCGCSIGGDYYPIGEKYTSSRCSTVYVCVLNRGGSKMLPDVNFRPCATNAVCNVIDGDRQCVCPSGFSGDGYLSCVRDVAPCHCVAKGDPHYTTYDDAHFSLYYDCQYKMAELVNTESDCYFRVEVKNAISPNSHHPHRAFTRMVEVKVGTDRIRMKKNKFVEVNGVRVTPPLVTSLYNITEDGLFTVVTTACGVRVAFNGGMEVRVSTPGTLRGNLTGLCGNCNGERADDLEVYGKSFQSFRSPRAAVDALARSYLVEDTSDKPSTNPKCYIFAT